MKRTYSLYDAKAKLSEIVRIVRERKETVTISYHGRPVAEIRPVEVAGDENALEARLQELTARGVITPPTGQAVDVRPIAKRPGALRRFLEDRD